jgi:hypothetical protein
LAEIVTDGNFPTKRIATADHIEAIEIVGVGLDEHGNIQGGELERVGHAFFVAEIGQDD